MKIKNISRKLLVLIFAGLAFRLVLMPITLHPDLWAISFSEYLFAFKGVNNIYDYLGDLPTDSALVRNYGPNFFTYPPLAYFTLGIFGLLLKPFFDTGFLNNLAVNLPEVLNYSKLSWHLFITKLPYLFFDFGILFLLRGLVDKGKQKTMISALWLFNPLVLYTSYMIGQFDIIPIFFTVLSLYLAKKQHWSWAAFSLGVGGSYKMFPLFFLPFLAFNKKENFLKPVKYIAVGLLPYVLSLSPFLSSANFRQVVLLSNQSQKMFFAKIFVSGAEYLSVFLIVYIFLLALSGIIKRSLWKWFLVVMLGFFSVTHYHPQWFLWISPFLLLFMVEFSGLVFYPITLYFCWLAITLMFEPSLSFSLFAPLQNTLLEATPASEWIAPYFDPFLFRSIVRSVFAGLAVFIGFSALKLAEIPEKDSVTKLAVRMFAAKKKIATPK